MMVYHRFSFFFLSFKDRHTLYEFPNSFIQYAIIFFLLITPVAFSNAQQIIQAPPTRGEVEMELRKLTEQLQLLDNKYTGKSVSIKNNLNNKIKDQEGFKLSENEYIRNKSEIESRITYWNSILISIAAAEEMGIFFPVEKNEEISPDKFMNSNINQGKITLKRSEFNALPVEKRSKIQEQPDLYEIVN